MNKITITEQISRLSTIASKNKNRSGITGVYVDKDKNQTVATDGSKMVILPIITDEIDTSILLVGLSKLTKQDSEVFQIYDGKAVAKENIKNSCAYKTETEVSYPKYSEIIQDKIEGVTEICFNASYLLEISKVLNNSDKDTSVKLTFSGRNGVIKVTSTNRHELGVGYLMPVRSK